MGIYFYRLCNELIFANDRHAVNGYGQKLKQVIMAGLSLAGEGATVPIIREG